MTLPLVVILLIAALGWLLGPLSSVIWFGSVLLHELGHSLIAQRFHIPIASIDLHVFGGMAMLTRPARTPLQEILIAAAGPFVSILLGVLFYGAAILSGAQLGVDLRPVELVDLTMMAAYLNLAMGIFNLIPALPMDGGRILRSSLSFKLGGLRATRIAANVSRVFAVIFVLIGLFQFHPSFLIIGLLLFIMVGHEERISERMEMIRQAQIAVPTGPVVDVTPSGDETREEYFDPHGRRYVVITRLQK